MFHILFESIFYSRIYLILFVKATVEQMSLINKYLQSLSFGDIEYLHSFEREKEILENLKRITNKDSHFLLGSKLFSHIVTQRMALYNKSRQLGYLFQQDFLEVFKKLYKETRDKDYLLNLDYPSHLWLEKEIKSVANVARRDVREFLELAAEIPLIPEVQEFQLEEANTALLELKERKIRGAKVLKIG